MHPLACFNSSVCVSKGSLDLPNEGMALDRYAAQEVVILSKLTTHKGYQIWHQHKVLKS
ncbi:hypothetical protein RHMOL_Rhmol08G0229800 [Rhododendron molle]|uniref:Uncharacterized protein n=1 Tax=Rhododendron molle TaxID=49168 RepID=A0ACC0MTE1_RHOML|nr:hypothetical protein RHMOL_Rhmol08G0229800 [Rhododendron molle]